MYSVYGHMKLKNMGGHELVGNGWKFCELYYSVQVCIMAATLKERLWQCPYCPVLSPRYFLATAPFGPHSVLWQPGAQFGRSLLFLLSVLELPLHRVEHCSNLWPAAALLQSRKETGGANHSHMAFIFCVSLWDLISFLYSSQVSALFFGRGYLLFFCLLKCTFCLSYKCTY